MLRTYWALMALAALPAVCASDTDMDRATLRGLKAVKVVIDPLQPELQKEGFTPNELRAQIEQRLHTAGIPVDQNAKEFLGLTVKSMRAKKSPVVILFTLGFYQVAELAREKGLKTVAETWGVQDAMMVQSKMLNQVSRTAIDNLVEQFINAYSSVNPK